MGLLIELKKGQRGWVLGDTLMSKELINFDDPNDFRKFNELRKYAKGYLLQNNAFEFIKNNKNKEYRIATHPDFIKHDREKLLDHNDSKIGKLAEELP